MWTPVYLLRIYWLTSSSFFGFVPNITRTSHKSAVGFYPSSMERRCEVPLERSEVVYHVDQSMKHIFLFTRLHSTLIKLKIDCLLSSV